MSLQDSYYGPTCGSAFCYDPQTPQHSSGARLQPGGICGECAIQGYEREVRMQILAWSSRPCMFPFCVCNFLFFHLGVSKPSVACSKTTETMPYLAVWCRKNVFRNTPIVLQQIFQAIQAPAWTLLKHLLLTCVVRLKIWPQVGTKAGSVHGQAIWRLQLHLCWLRRSWQCFSCMIKTSTFTA